MALLEVACFSANDAVAAWNAGADRIELCNDREAGGTTPSYEALLAVKHRVSIPVFVMIRPRGGDFKYTDMEFDQMKADIDAFKSKADGYVFGVLDRQYNVDLDRTSELVAKASPHPCTFHRAFDETLDLVRTLQDVVFCGCRAILSSGGAPNAVSGASMLRELVRQAQGDITVIPGGGVRAEILPTLQALTGASVYHSSGILSGRTELDESEIRRMKTLLHDQSLS